MKKEASGKKGKVLWLVLGIVLLVAIVTGVVLALVLGGQEQTTGGRPALYWNVDRADNIDKYTNLSTREPAEDGNYYIRFAYEGEQIELAVADKKLVNYIDSLDLAHLVLDKDGTVIDVYPPQAVASEIGATLYVQSVTDDAIIANSSVTMNGRKVNIKLDAGTTVYNVSGTGAFVGEALDVKALNSMDTIGVYGTFVPEDSEEESVVTHIFVTSKPVESPVYWRADAYYDSANKTTARIPDENGAYTIKWFVDGETVELKCKNEELVASVDKADYHWCHWGLEFDEDGYIINTLNSALSSRTLLQCERFDITELYDDGSYVATSLIKNNGSFVQGTVGPDCKIYDVSKTARSEWQVNRQLDSLQLGDRVCIWTDTTGKPVLIYVTNRIVESDIFWVVTRSYNSTTQQTTRKPNADGYYEIELLRVGDTKNTIYYAKDIETASIIDEPTDRCVGLKLSEGNIIEYAYPSECLFGNTYFSRGYFVIDITGSVGTYLSNAGSGFSMNGVLAADCKVINVSTVGEYGAETTLVYGDSVYAYKAPNGEIAHIFVAKRLTGPETMYFRLSTRQYDATNKVTTRVPDADGYYVYEFTNQGKTVTLRTKDKKIANLVDGASRADMGLTVKGNIITEVHDYSYPLGGLTNNGYFIKEINGDEITIWNTSGKEYIDVLAENCEVYNVSTSWLDHKGEKTTLKVGDYVSVYRNINYEVGFIYVHGRQTDKMAWPADRQVGADGLTTRTPDENGWYYIDLAVDGKVSTYKTKNKNVLDAVESYTSAFGIKLSGNEILYTSTYSYVENVYGRGVTNYTVTSVSGNTVKVLYTLGHATSTGTTQELTLNEGVKIFDVSDPSSPDFGKATKVKAGDMIQTYTYRMDRTLTQYIFVVAHCTREGGYQSYCDHCDKVVYWNPYISSANSVDYDCHYYLASDVKHDSQMRVYGSEKLTDLEIVLDLNGHTLHRENGRLVFVRYGGTLTIIDSVGGGQIKSRNNTSIGGVISVGGPEKGLGPSTLNLYGGTITMDTDEGVADYAYRGGLVTSSGIFNMYGGEIVGGFVRGQNSSGSTAAGVQINDGEFNMYGGKIADGIADGGFYEVAVKDKDGNPVIDETTGLPKVDKKIITSYAGNLHVNGVNAVVNMYGGSIENGKAARGGNVTVGNGTFIMHGGLISGGVASQEYGATSDGRGGNFFVTGNSKVIIKGGTVTGGKAIDGSGMGGNFISSSLNSTIYIEGGTVTDGEAKSGNNISLMYSHLNVSGGKILEGAVTTGTNVTATGTTSGYSTVTISGGKVDGEVLLTGGVSSDADAKYPDYRTIATVSGGEMETLNATNVQKVTVSGNPVIENLQVGGGVLLDVGAMTNGANITMKTAGVFTKPVENAQNYTGYFHSAEEGYLTGVSANNELRFYNPNATLAYCEHCDAEAEWMPWDGESVVTGHYYLTDNVQLTQQLDVAADFILDLKGYTITAAADSRVFLVKGGGILSILDTSAAKTGTITGGAIEGRGGNIYVETSGTFNLYSGTVTAGVTKGNVSVSDGRGGNIFATGAVNLYGGTVSNGVAMTGHGMGGNIMMTGATLTVYENATIIGGQGKDGNNVKLMYGDLVNYGTISNGSVSTGYSVVVSSMANRRSSTLTVEDGTIDGIVYVSCGTPAEGVEDYRAVVAINGGEIANLQLVDTYANAVAFSGAPVIDSLTVGENILLDVAQLTDGASVKIDATSGVITDVLDNADDVVGYFDAVANGYDVVVNADNKLEVTSGGSGTPDPDPSGSKCEHCGTDVAWTTWNGTAFTESGHYRMEADVNSADQITIASGVEVTLDLNGFSLTAASGKRNFEVAGTLILQDSSANGTGKVIGSTVVNLHGGNINVNKGTFHMYGGTVTGGTIEGAYYGGNLMVQGNTGNAHIHGGVISNGTAARGGNIYISGTVVTISGDAQILGGYAIGSGTSIRGGNIYITSTASSLTVSDNAVIADGVSDYAAGNIYCMYGNMEFKDNVQVKNGTDTVGNGNMDIGGTSNPSTVIISGGTFENGDIAISGSGTGAANVTVSGGTFKDEVRTTVATALTVSGNPVFENLKMAAGGLITVGELTDGASIKVNATSGVITDALTNADDMVGYFDTVAADRTVVVNAEDKLEIAEACPCGCKTLVGDVQWQDLKTYIANDGSPVYKFNADAHYVLSDDLDIAEFNAGGKQLVVGDSAACNIVIDLNGHTYYNEDRIYIYEGSSVTIVDTSAEGTGTLDIPGDASRAAAGRGFYLKGTLNLRSGTIKLAENAFVSDRALIHLAGTNAVFNMYGGTVTGGKAQTNVDTTAHVGVGGNIYVSTGTFNMYGGTVSNGTTTDLTNGDVTYTGMGGNIYGADTAVINIYGGTITGGTSTLGADIYLAAYSSKGGVLNISGGNIAGEIYVAGAKATVTVSDTAVIGNLNLQGESVVNVGNLATGAMIGINKIGDFTDVLENAERYLPFFTSVDDAYMVNVTDDNKLTLVSNNACPCGCGADKDQVTWVDPAAYMNAAAASWNYKITESVHLRLESDFDVNTFFGRVSQIQIGADANTPANVTIDLNGNTWSNTSRFYLSNNSVLTILDTSAEQTGRVLVTGDSGTGGMIYVGGTMNLLSGTLTMADESQGQFNKGGIVYVSGGVFNMYGGSVVNGKALTSDGRGGNVFVNSGGFNMYGGTISGGTAATTGANVYISANCVFNYVGGTIDDYDNTVSVN